MIIPAYTSITSEKLPPNSSRNFLLEVGPIKYAEAVRTLAKQHKSNKQEEVVKPKEKAEIQYVQSEPFIPIAGKTADELKQWLDVKNPSPIPKKSDN